MAIASQKLLPQSRSGAMVPIKKTAITRITPIAKKKAVPTEGSKDTLVVIKERCIEINTLLKGSLALDKIRADRQRKKVEQQKRAGQEDNLESKKKGKEEKGSGLSMPKIGFLDRMKNFIKNILLGFILVRLIEFAPILQKIIPVIAGITEFISDVFLGIIDGLGTFLDWGFSAWESSEEKLKEWGGEDAAKDLNKLGDTLGDLFNAIAIVGMVAARVSPQGTKNLLKREAGLKPKTPPKTPLKPTGPGGRPGMNPTGPRGASRAMQLKHGPEARAIYDNARANGKSIAQAKAAVNRALRSGKIVSKPQFGTLKGDVATPKGNIMKKGLKGSAKRLGVKLFGKAGLKTVKGVFGRIPILGPIVVAVASLLAGEPIGQALFKGVGAALGGLLGSFIPIPVVGTLLGETLGTFVGDLLYSLILGGGPDEALRKLQDAIKTAMDVGGLVIDFFKEGFGRFFKDFPVVDIPKGGGLQTALGKVAGLIGLGDNKKFMEDGRLVKVPNLSILFNPFAMITELIPHAAKSFFPAIFGEGGTAFGGSGTVTITPETSASVSQSVSTSTTSGGSPRQMRSQGKAGMNINDKGNAIYLHWTAGNYNSIGGPYHTVFTGDGTMHRKFEYGSSTGGHTYNRNGGGSVGLSLAANPDIGQWPTEEQRVAMAKEAARIAKKWGWTKNEITTKKVMTHGEAGSNVDGYNAHTNYGPFGRGRSDTTPDKDKTSVGKLATVERWDLDKLNSHKDLYGSGGDEMRNRIKGFMRMGGQTRGKGLYMMAEEGKEFVIDADSTRALQGTFPGLLKALNKAQGDEAINVLRSYAEYEMGEVIPVPVPIPQPIQNVASDAYGKAKTSVINVITKGKEAFSDMLYMR
tara:strand:+ start:984 stop:3572 length:2589 start_codon:yes stop_codon:yes gene_type:complete